ncbi:periplasmic sugar-binding protein [Alkaliphilus metalliredigens QYMF]|uniref:Periplasmic sugar-binding protein n=1 Tax=Alkaliphilus metalliredigens (strain QYMF) TaxID=293826 RepID=A6TS00_ALKMQ|nr:sugar-binding protein [Alkaliphilus metalliredigens]ABR48968.1 periplasmic sugar-binding protein [Alkaliphilus metalliredigens QYMF]
MNLINNNKKIGVVTKYLIFILVFLICVTGILLLWLRSSKVTIFTENPRYHFYFVGQNAVDPYWKEIRQGAEQAARDHNVVVEFNAPRFYSPEEELKYLDIAILSEVDGIITHVSSGEDFTTMINKAYYGGIPVVTVENDDKISNRAAFVGTNGFLLGTEAGKLMVEATGGKANIAIIVSNNFEPDAASQNIRINGFLSELKEYPDMEVVQTYTSRMGILSAEEITQSILNGGKDIDAIFTMTSVDTLGSVQLIIDQNKVGEITMIGFGDAESTLRYIEKGIIYGTVMSDPYRMGYESVQALIDIKEKNNVSSFIDTGVKVIKRENLHEYEERLEFLE